MLNYVQAKQKSFSYDGAKLWNSLPVDVRNSETLTIFKERIRAHTVQWTEYNSYVQFIVLTKCPPGLKR